MAPGSRVLARKKNRASNLADNRRLCALAREEAHSVEIFKNLSLNGAKLGTPEDEKDIIIYHISVMYMVQRIQETNLQKIILI